MGSGRSGETAVSCGGFRLSPAPLLAVSLVVSRTGSCRSPCCPFRGLLAGAPQGAANRKCRPARGGNPRSMGVLRRGPCSVNQLDYGNIHLTRLGLGIMSDDENVLLAVSFLILLGAALGDLTYWYTATHPPGTALSFLSLLPFFIAMVSKAPRLTGVFILCFFGGTLFFWIGNDVFGEFRHTTWVIIKWFGAFVWLASLLWASSLKFRYFLSIWFRPSVAFHDDPSEIDPESGQWRPAIEEFLKRNVLPRR